MNYDVGSDNIFVKNIVFEGCQEVPLDVDFSLPDYCQDIQKILKCSVSPNITSRNILGDRLNVDGNVKVKIIYLDAEKKSVCCFENTEEFSCSIDLRVSPDNAVAVTCSKLEYVNCRAMSPRRIDIHGAIAICAKVYNKISQDTTCSINSEDVQQKKEELFVSNLDGIGQQQFSISEMLDFGQNKPNPEIILRTDVSLIPKECKKMDNKVMLKGEALVKILYIYDITSKQTDVMEYSIPFNQLVDVPGGTEDGKCTIFLEVLGHEEQIQSEYQGDANLVSEDIKAAATVMAYTDKKVEVVNDAYSTKYDMECNKETFKFCKIEENIESKFSINSQIEFNEFNILKVIDVWGENVVVNGKYEDGKIIFDGKMNICVLALDNEEIPFYIERIVEINHEEEINTESDDVFVQSMVVPLAIGYRILTSNSIDVKCDMGLSADIYSCKKCNMVVSASASEATPKTKDCNVALTVYYADKGESIWDIARKYYTSSDDIKEENGISNDEIDQYRMLLIPMDF